MSGYVIYHPVDNLFWSKASGWTTSVLAAKVYTDQVEDPPGDWVSVEAEVAESVRLLRSIYITLEGKKPPSP